MAGDVLRSSSPCQRSTCLRTSLTSKPHGLTTNSVSLVAPAGPRRVDSRTVLTNPAAISGRLATARSASGRIFMTVLTKRDGVQRALTRNILRTER